jgi:hypothetical protein
MYIIIGSDTFGNFKIKDHTEVNLEQTSLLSVIK